MLQRAKALTGYKLSGLDGDIGSVKDFSFDERFWAIRYVVAETGGWLTGREVLISPYALDLVRPEDGHITANVTKRQIEAGPFLTKDELPSRQFEEAYYTYFGWPLYWGGPHMWGATPHITRGREQWREPVVGEQLLDSHLHSSNAVRGYHVRSMDGPIGHVDDFIVDDETWAIRYLVIATRDWWPGNKVLVSPQWINNLSWSDSRVSVTLSRAAVKQSPPYTEESLLTRDYEADLHRHYRHRGYWADDPTPEAIPLQ